MRAAGLPRTELVVGCGSLATNDEHRPYMTLRQYAAIVTAIVAWGALTLQCGLIIERMTSEGATALQAIWRFVGFFTILTNLLVAIVSSALVLRPMHPLASAPMRLAALTAILMVGIVYSVALRAIWSPTGLQAIVDSLLHDVTPVLFLLTWIAFPHGDLRWRDMAPAILVPLAYFAYAMTRGAFDGWYAYWFLDPSQQSIPALGISIAILIAAFALVATLAIWADRWLAGRRT